MYQSNETGYSHFYMFYKANSALISKDYISNFCRIDAGLTLVFNGTCKYIYICICA